DSLTPGGTTPAAKLRRKLAVPSQGRLYYIRYALKMGWSVEQVHELTNIDPWFLAQMKELVDAEGDVMAAFRLPGEVDPERMMKVKQLGYSDTQIAYATGAKTDHV